MEPQTTHAVLVLRNPENRNAAWINGTGAWITYIIAIVLSILLLLVFFPSFIALTVVNVLHSVITFFAFHWVKGAPFSTEGTYVGESKYSKLTLWEQLDSGVQYTPTRKFLTVVPILLFLLTSHYTAYDLPILFLNSIAFIVIFIAKQPFMIKKRLFGINKE